jgi:hypothetical protein
LLNTLALCIAGSERAVHLIGAPFPAFFNRR